MELRARCSGYFQSLHFDEGQILHEADLLFVIDTRPFEAELNGATAAKRQAESQLQPSKTPLEEAKARQLQSDARLALAESGVNRARQLDEQNAVSQEELDQRQAEFLQGKAGMAASEAGIRSAEAAITTAEATVASADAGVETAQSRSGN